jgi:hypothetical protein
VIGEVDLSGGVGGGPVVDRAAVSETVLVSFLRQGEMLKKVSRPEMAAHSPVQYQRVAASTTVCSPSTSRPPRAAANPYEVEACRPYRFRMPQAGYATVDSG